MKSIGFIISNRNFEAVIFDLDGVVTKTARIHAAVWKKLFDEYFKEKPAKESEKFQSFDIGMDYPRYLVGFKDEVFELQEEHMKEIPLER